MRRRVRDGHPHRDRRPAERGATVRLEPIRSVAATWRQPDPRHRGHAAVRGALVPRRVSVETGFAAALDGGTRLYWESTGRGRAGTADHGLGLSGGAWWRTVAALARRLRVITFDHRGIGRSRVAHASLHDRGDGRRRRVACSTRRASSARTCTASRSAAWSPSSWRCGTRAACGRWSSARRSPGGPRAARSRRRGARRSSARRPRMRSDEAARASVPYNYGPRLPREHAERIEEDIARRLASPFSDQAYRASCSRRRCTTAAGGCRGSRSRRSSCTAPTTVWSPSRTRILMAERHPRRAPGDPRRVGPPLPDGGARGRRGDRRVPRGARRGGRSVSLAIPRGAELRVADVVRRAAAERGGAVALRHGDAGDHVPRARRAHEPARTGAARRRRAPRRARRAPRPHRAGGHRAALRGEQDRGGPRAAELAPRGAELARVVADARPPRPRRRPPFAAAAARARRGPRRCASSRSAPATRPGCAAHDASRSGLVRRRR